MRTGPGPDAGSGATAAGATWAPASRITWFQDFPDQPLEHSGFYLLHHNVPEAGVWHACSVECQQHIEQLFAFIDIMQDRENIRTPIFHWVKLDPTLDVGGI